MYAVSSNHFSVDQQIADAIDALPDDDRALFNAEFPEWDNLVWSGSWVDTDASGVDVEYTSWVADWLESRTGIFWEEGEPWMREDDDDDDEFDYDDEPERVTTDPSLPRGTTVKVDGRSGVAWHVLYVERRPNGDESVHCQMIGDDRSEPFNRDDLTVIEREDFCGQCGQLGCEHDGLDR
jgi:hypothetical protein